MIKARMRISHGSVRAWEVANGLPKDAVRDTFRGRFSQRTARAIAHFVGVPFAQLFPGRTIIRDATSRKRESHRLNAGAR